MTNKTKTLLMAAAFAILTSAEVNSQPFTYQGQLRKQGNAAQGFPMSVQKWLVLIELNNITGQFALRK